MRLIGVDFGSVRIGIAVGESEFRLASPRANLRASGTLAKDAGALVTLAQNEQAEAFVIGIPYEPDGGEGRMVRVCRLLAAELRTLGMAAFEVDERLTSKQSDDELYQQGLKASVRRKLVDGESAVRILERYFDEQGQA